MGNPNYSTLLTTTLEERQPVVRDLLLNNIPLLKELKKKGNVKKFSGGTKMTHALMTANAGTFQFYTGSDQLNRSSNEFMTMAEFAIKQAAEGIQITGLEQLQNTGEAQMFDLMEQRISSGEKSFQNGLASSIESDGTGSGGKEIGGLKYLIADDPTTGTMGGIDRATNSFWRNVAASQGSATTAANIQARMDDITMQLVRNGEYADLFYFGSNYYKAYRQSLQAIQRITSEDEGGAGYANLAYYGPGGKSRVVLGGGRGGTLDANRGYFLNTDHIFWRPHSQCDMVVKGGERVPTDFDMIVRYVFWAGNLTTDDAGAHGVMFDAA